jgi:ubiquinone/menaquinone biosynthesis C-methylase UbiE
MDISNVYNNIANDFSNTRHKTWPSVAKFIDTFKETDLNADIGCGNGKNMIYKPLKFKGMDICDEFIKICKERELDVIKGNILSIPFESNMFDNIISIAVVHHLSSREERILAIKELFRICKYSGKFMIYVWAFIQPIESKRQFKTQDEMVPFKKVNGEVHYRYYHLYKENELEEEVNSSGISFKHIESGYERGNYYVIITK